MKLHIHFTGMTLIHLVEEDQDSTYRGHAYFLGGDHEPVLVVALKYIRNVAADMPLMGTIYPPGGPICGVLSLKGQSLTMDPDGQATGVCFDPIVRPSRSPTADAWKNLGYIVDIDYLARTKEKPARLADDAVKAAGAIMALDRGALSAVAPTDPPLSDRNWRLTPRSGEPAVVQKLAGTLLLEVNHEENQFAFLIGKKASKSKKQRRLLIGHWEKKVTTPIPVSIYSLCDVRGTTLTELPDVRLYRKLLFKKPPIVAPKIHNGKASGDTGQCPPARLITRK